MKQPFDLLIVGGGITGLTLACALAQSTALSIAIIESVQSVAQVDPSRWRCAPPSFETRALHAPQDERDHFITVRPEERAKHASRRKEARSAVSKGQPKLYDQAPRHQIDRVSAITLSSQRIFQSLNVWDTICAQGVSPFSCIQVWDAEGEGEIQFTHKEINEALLGFIIENNMLQFALQEKLQNYPQVQSFAPITLTDFSEQENELVLTAADGRTFSAPLAVAADGANSWLRTQAGITVEKKDYAQVAIVATVHTALAHSQSARQVFLATGPLAFLPLAHENMCSIVWSLPTTEAERCMALSDDAFRKELADAFSQRLGAVLSVENRRAFPLSTQQAKHYIKSRIALIGDAAHTIHPLAGQGVNMGLLDAVSLAEVITDACHAGRNFASASTLRHYERWRKADNLPLFKGVDVIKHAFASNKPALQQLRSLGLSLTNDIAWLKSHFTRYAVGNRQNLPRLAAIKAI